MEGSKSKRAVARQFAPTRLSEQWLAAAYQDAIAASQTSTIKQVRRRSSRSAPSRKRPLSTTPKTGGPNA